MNETLHAAVKIAVSAAVPMATVCREAGVYIRPEPGTKTKMWIEPRNIQDSMIFHTSRQISGLTQSNGELNNNILFRGG